MHISGIWRTGDSERRTGMYSLVYGIKETAQQGALEAGHGAMCAAQQLCAQWAQIADLWN